MNHAQAQYQVRFEWGVDGATAIAEGADVVVLVDVLSEGDTLAEPLVEALAGHHATIVAGSLRNRRAVAEWVLAQQDDKGERFFVAVVAAGETWGSGASRFAVEDLLAAGAVIDALADAGIDYCSPEAAAASAAFTGLRNATGHLIGASSSGRELAANGRRAEIDDAIAVDASPEVTVLREFAPRA